MATAIAPRESTATRTGALGTVATAAVVVVAWAVTLPRLVPGSTGDHGTFMSVAERLLAGDRLYVDVWDNKDPLFYYLLAAGRLVTPLADILIEVIWVVVACIAVLRIARSAGAHRDVAVATAFGGIPLLLTGAAYDPGMTHLPGVALTLAAIAFALGGRWVIAGVVVALVLFTKLIAVPVGVGALFIVVLHRHDRAGLMRAAVGAVVTVLAGLGTLWLRGELPGWVENFSVNVEYADGELSTSRYGSAVGHLLRAFPEDGRGAGLVTVGSIVLILLAIRRSPPVMSPSTRDRGAEQEDVALTQTLLWDVTAVTLLLGLAVIAVSATWPHHLQTLYVSAALALVLLAVRQSRPGGGWRPVVVVALAAYVAGGVAHPYLYVQSVRDVGSNVEALRATSPDSQVITQLPQVHTYARAGTNDITAHAVGLGDLDLACPKFHQYPIDTPAALDAVATCLPRADVLIVDDSIRGEPGEPAWNAYVARIRAIVASGYDCLPTIGSQVCVKQR